MNISRLLQLNHLIMCWSERKLSSVTLMLRFPHTFLQTRMVGFYFASENNAMQRMPVDIYIFRLLKVFSFFISNFNVKVDRIENAFRSTAPSTALKPYSEVFLSWYEKISNIKLQETIFFCFKEYTIATYT